MTGNVADVVIRSISVFSQDPAESVSPIIQLHYSKLGRGKI